MRNKALWLSVTKPFYVPTPISTLYPSLEITFLGNNGRAISSLSSFLILQQSNIEAVKSGIQGKIPTNQLAELWLKLIDEVIEDTRYSIPVPTPQHALTPGF